MSWNIRDKVVLVTGGNAGIGKETAIALARAGARVTITSRQRDRGLAALSEIRAASDNETVDLATLDLASFASIRDCVAAFHQRSDRLDVLINNAGLILDERMETAEGFEMTFGVNHLGPFLLTKLLLDTLEASAPARIITVSSAAHRASRGLPFDDLQRKKSYSAFPVYSDSKLANIYFTRELARRIAGSGVTANALHPGVIASRFGRDGDVAGAFGLLLKIGAPFLSTPVKGAQTSIFLATSADLDGISGAYFARRREARLSAVARDDEAAARLWRVSEELVASADGHQTATG